MTQARTIEASEPDGRRDGDRWVSIGGRDERPDELDTVETGSCGGRVQL
jgi:hypothetical protein